MPQETINGSFFTDIILVFLSNLTYKLITYQRVIQRRIRLKKVLHSIFSERIIRDFPGIYINYTIFLFSYLAHYARRDANLTYFHFYFLLTIVNTRS